MGLLTANEVAVLLNLSQTKIYELARTGELPHYRFGSSVRFNQQEVQDYIQSCKSAATVRRTAAISNLKVSIKAKESGLEGAFQALGIKLKPTRAAG